MAIINFLGPIELDSIELEVSNMNELKTKLKEIDKLKEWLPICAVSINDTLISIDENLAINSGDVVSLLPPVCGG